MTPVTIGDAVLHMGDCIERMRGMADASVDSIVTDPPYELGFMGKGWDSTGIANSVEMWTEALRVLKPGGHMLAFSGSRTYHRMVCAIEDAGFEIRDQIMWVYGSGFPKSLDVSKAIDKVRRRDYVFAAVALGFEVPGNSLHDWTKAEHSPSDKWWNELKAVLSPEQWGEIEREVIGQRTTGIGTGGGSVAIMGDGRRDITAPATDAARQWQGWGTALKPSFEPLVLAHKPFENEALEAIIGSKLHALEARLWSMSLANAAANNSASSPSEFDEACATARWSAGDATSTRDALCDRMGTSQFESATSSSLNIVSSWRRTLAEASALVSMSTIGTESRPTTDWTTLKSSLSKITAESIILAQTSADGPTAPAKHAVAYFSAALSKLKGTLELSAVERAMSKDRIDFRDVDEKVSHEPICMARKPLTGTVAANVLEWGTGAINVDACRVDGKPRTTHADGNFRTRNDGPTMREGFGVGAYAAAAGRWPANLIHSGEPEVLAAFPTPHGAGAARCADDGTHSGKTGMFGIGEAAMRFGDTGSAARFFMQCPPDDAARLIYCAKASKKDRDEGLEGMEPVHRVNGNKWTDQDYRVTSGERPPSAESGPRRNVHPTVKPTTLMRYLCRLVTPPGGLVLDPFMGSGSTGKAAILEGFRFIGIDLHADHVELAAKRIEHARRQGHQPSLIFDGDGIDDCYFAAEGDLARREALEREGRRRQP